MFAVTKMGKGQVHCMTVGEKKEDSPAIADFTMAIEIDPKYSLAYSNRANAFEAKGEKMLADKDRQKARELEGLNPSN